MRLEKEGCFSQNVIFFLLIHCPFLFTSKRDGLYWPLLMMISSLLYRHHCGQKIDENLVQQGKKERDSAAP